MKEERADLIRRGHPNPILENFQTPTVQGTPLLNGQLPSSLAAAPLCAVFIRTRTDSIRTR